MDTPSSSSLVNGNSAASNGEPASRPQAKVVSNEQQAEVEAAEEVINSMLYYRDHAKLKMRMQTKAMMYVRPALTEL